MMRWLLTWIGTWSEQLITFLIENARRKFGAYREANMVAVALANHWKELPREWHLFDDPSDYFRHVLTYDSLNGLSSGFIYNNGIFLVIREDNE